MVIHIIQVLVSQLSTIIINLSLDIVRMVEIDRMAFMSKHIVHLSQRLIYQLKHLMNVFTLLGSKLLLVFTLTLNGTGKIKATVTNTLDFRNLTQHRTDLRLGIITQMSIAHLIKILGNLYLHIIRNTFILLNTLIELVESLGILSFQQLSHHTKHTMDALAETADFLLCLEDRKFWCLHDASLDKAQTEIFILLICLRLDKFANNFFQLWDKPNQNACVTNIETGMEHRQDNWQQLCLLCRRHTTIRIIPHDRANEIYKWIEQAENPDYTKDIEYQMGQGCTTSLGIGTQSGKIGCSGSSDILTHHQGNTQIDREYACRTE